VRRLQRRVDDTVHSEAATITATDVAGVAGAGAARDPCRAVGFFATRVATAGPS
jgi:hypothetical protein